MKRWKANTEEDKERFIDVLVAIDTLKKIDLPVDLYLKNLEFGICSGWIVDTGKYEIVDISFVP